VLSAPVDLDTRAFDLPFERVWFAIWRREMGGLAANLGLGVASLAAFVVSTSGAADIVILSGGIRRSQTGHQLVSKFIASRMRRDRRGVGPGQTYKEFSTT